ncbi:mercury resistance system periplasmic binding protein MerP [Hyphomonas sp.]|uniref:mercury resistance system periplasmic binding protein MerP n=1 Tax=Alphaproteobacteria TaxID=28211 RepID=UPI003264E0CE
MKKTVAALTLGLALLASASAFAAEKTVKLAVPGMYCASCPFIVKTSISAVDGVLAVETTLEDRTAVVTFDDAVTSLDAITQATANAGYESSLVEVVGG